MAEYPLLHPPHAHVIGRPPPGDAWSTEQHPYSAPLLHLLPHAALASHSGLLLYKYYKYTQSLDYLYHQALAEASRVDVAWSSPGWAAREFAHVFMESQVPKDPVIHAFCLRALL
uniref:Uncharacterized protein n=1 Tax=Eutreptiella gymnastica TaxID=73025 RepID=A0A7S4CVL6_9EUGL